MERPELPPRLRAKNADEVPPKVLPSPFLKPSVTSPEVESSPGAPSVPPSLPAEPREPVRASSVSNLAVNNLLDREAEMRDDSESVNFMKVRKSARGGLAKKELSRWKKRALIAGAAVGVPVVLIATLFQFSTVPSASMLPTVSSGDLLVSFRFADRTPHDGDLVVFNGKGLDWGDENYLKRVIGTSGQTVECCDAEGSITVDGATLSEPYLKDLDLPASGSGFSFVVAEDSFFALGDNRYASRDSRYFFDQSVPYSSVVGKPFMGVNISDFRVYKL